MGRACSENVPRSNAGEEFSSVEHSEDEIARDASGIGFVAIDGVADRADGSGFQSALDGLGEAARACPRREGDRNSEVRVDLHIHRHILKPSTETKTLLVISSVRKGDDFR